VRRYLESLQWDGTERTQHFAHDILGAGDTPFLRSVSAAMLIAAVARAMDPGCKVDTIPVLEGEQGILKSTAIGILFRPWFTDDIAELGTKEAADQIRKTWCAEIADLAGFKRADIEKIKAFTSRRVDTFRPAYGRSVIEAPRQAVMWATTNETEWNKDPSGARRFWPIACGRIDIKRLERERDLIWAEAVNWYRKGEAWWLTDAETQRLAREEQEQRQISDAWDDRVETYVAKRGDVSVGEVLQECIGLEAGKWGQTEQNRIARFLRRKGWKRRFVGPKGQQKWRYFAPETGQDGQLSLEYPESGL
jgi:predicted P-loop ATPase